MTAALMVGLIAPVGAQAELDGDFAAQADASLLYLDAVNFGSLTAEPPVGSLGVIGVSPTQAQVDNPDGLGDGVLSRGYGRNLDLSLFDTEVPLDLSTAEQTAPPDNGEAAVTTLIPLSAAAPLLTGAVSESTALARDPNAVSCPDMGRTPISLGTSTTTDLGVLEIAEGTSLASVQGAGEGTLTAASGTYVGSAGEIIAEGSAQTAEVNLADELRIEVSNPVLTATAPGTPGDATVTYSGEVRVNGEKIAGTQENEISLDALVDVLTPLDEMLLNEVFGPLDEMLLAELEGPLADVLDPLGITDFTLPDLEELINNDVIDVGELLGLKAIAYVTAGELENVDIAADGTHASGEVKTVRIELNLVSSLLGTEVPILTFHLMPLAASADVPAGGLDCGGNPEDPFDQVRKDVTAARVRPGTTFDYAITVPNTAECTVTDVTVTDVVEGPAGFTISDTTPDGTVDGDTVTWEIDKLEPNEVATFIVTVTVPTTAVNGDTFSDHVTVTGTCDDEPVEGGDDIVDVPVVTTDSLPGCDVSPSNKDSTHLEVKPGQAFSYLIHAYNAGEADCGATTITDTLPDNVGFVSCSPACTNEGSTVTFELDNLAAGESVVLSITVTAPDEVGAAVPNVAVIDPTNGGTATVTDPGPQITDRSILSPIDPADFTATPVSLPRTGGGLALLGLGAMAISGRLRRR